MNTLELKTGEKIKVLNGACMEAEIRNNLSVMSGKVGNKNVKVLRDSGFNGVIVKRKLADEANFIGKVGYIMTVNRTLIRAPIARIEVNTPFYTVTVEAMCIKDPLFDLIIGNVPGARKPNDPNPEWGVVAAAVTRAQARERRNPKPLKVKEMTSKMAVDKEELVRLQEEDYKLENLKKQKKLRLERDTGFLVKNVEEFGTGYVSERMKWEIPESKFWCPSRFERK